MFSVFWTTYLPVKGGLGVRKSSLVRITVVSRPEPVPQDRLSRVFDYVLRGTFWERPGREEVWFPPAKEKSAG